MSGGPPNRRHSSDSEDDPDFARLARSYRSDDMGVRRRGRYDFWRVAERVDGGAEAAEQQRVRSRSDMRQQYDSERADARRAALGRNIAHRFRTVRHDVDTTPSAGGGASDEMRELYRQRQEGMGLTEEERARIRETFGDTTSDDDDEMDAYYSRGHEMSLNRTREHMGWGDPVADPTWNNVRVRTHYNHGRGDGVYIMSQRRALDRINERRIAQLRHESSSRLAGGGNNRVYDLPDRYDQDERDRMQRQHRAQQREAAEGLLALRDPAAADEEYNRRERGRGHIAQVPSDSHPRYRGQRVRVFHPGREYRREGPHETEEDYDN